MPYTTTRIDRRNLVKLAGWGMTGLRPPGRGNMRTQDTSPAHLAADVVAASQISQATAQADVAKRDAA